MRYGNTGVLVAALAVAALVSASPAAAQERADVLLEQAMHMEQVEGDLQRAVTLYQQLLRDYAANRRVAARAQLRIGVCYEALGLQEAQRAYQIVIDDYGDQSEVAGQARARLAALRPAPAAGRGPVARRLLSGEDMDQVNLFEMFPSPDGRRVVYADLYIGALHLRDLASGEEEELIPGLPAVWNWAPCWSPDGTRVAFLESDRESDVESMKILDLASRSVTPVPGTEMTDPRTGMVGRMPIGWSPDGQSLLYKSNPNGAGELGVVSVRGGTPRVLADSVIGASLSPDGRYVVYARGPQGSEQVFVQATSGSTLRQVTDAPGGNTDPHWAPDGTAIAYRRPDGIWVEAIVGGDGGGAPRLAHATADKLELRSWTEAGGLYFVRYSHADVPLQLVVEPASGTPVGNVEALPHPPDRVRAFAWSPDKQRIAYVVRAEHWETNAPRPEEGIAVHAADGSRTAMHAVTDPSEMIPSVWWSGDGREILYRSTVRGADEARQTVRALDPATGGIRELFPWSSSRVAYHLAADGDQALFFDRQALPDSSRVGWVVTGRDGSGGRLVVPLWNADGRAGQAQLTAQGDRLLFTRQKDMVATITGDAGSEPGTLWVVGTDGSGLRKVGAAHMIQSAVWDPSGRFIAYTAAVDNANSVLRMVDVATGAQRDLRLPDGTSLIAVTGWSRDGRTIGMMADASRYEFWTIQGLLDAVR